jgi:enoyl-CoA hydratase
MADWGLVSLIAADAELDAVVDGVVADLTSGSRGGLVRMKRLIDDGVDQPLEAALTGEQTMATLHTYSSDYAEGLRSFREERPPRFG